MPTAPPDNILEHADFLIKAVGMLLTLLGSALLWFGKRTVGKMDSQIDKLEETVEDINLRLTELEAEHRVRHQ